MAAESLKEFRKLDAEHLAAREQELRAELHKLRAQAATEKVKDVSQFKKVKKDIARVLTLRAESSKAKTK